MSSRIYSLFCSVARSAISSTTSSSSKFPNLLNKRIEGAARIPLNNLRNLEPIMTQKKIMPFEEFKIKKMKPIEEYKKEMKESFPEDSDSMFEESHESHCRAMYRTYLRLIENSTNDPGRMI